MTEKLRILRFFKDNIRNCITPNTVSGGSSTGFDKEPLNPVVHRLNNPNTKKESTQITVLTLLNGS
ncbi:hypothetical protein, partial [Pediococcus damnosus]|uniref:hypothetical protein n=1 Tax=Pediococcus damnosus TaxID=51663 RepID=UPI001C63BA38